MLFGGPRDRFRRFASEYVALIGNVLGFKQLGSLLKQGHPWSHDLACQTGFLREVCRRAGLHIEEKHACPMPCPRQRNDVLDCAHRTR